MKKQKVVSNSRDRNLLLLLATLVILFLIYNYAVTPILERGAMLKEELASAEAQLDYVTETIVNYPKLVEEEEMLSATVSDKYSVFFHEIVQERILYRLDTLIGLAELPVNRYSTSSVEAGPLDLPKPTFMPLEFPLFDLAAAVNPELLKEPPMLGEIGEGESIPVTDITLDFYATTFESAMSFMESVETMDKSIIMKNVAIRKADEAGIEGQFVMSFLSLPHIDNALKDYLKFSPVIPRGKVDPFN